ncbi:short-chain dehydrogenase, putative [Talaromyces stipitatus ATCC 10500]|uniref:Short-chain dehydrogenase, putative n=1 Tax=Talaromyces stipitatus (strain ATCC 10500 / CBS 375.48 / QM 6759 / NRRL 1006) TaxID=441959 RepID=B8MTR2_TALSN|nr:short-chain dehydrogenase, putative [Talaromyces stipitatus ATCC 10500]EED12547.1 short-chain dehydrogenase, putative [Talaromyces stipitatus ATCC 10500]
MATFPSLTKTWHTVPYPAISPLKPLLSAADKTILITGGGGGIGAGIARAFAAAGSTQIAIIGRRQDVLATTAKELEASFNGLRVIGCVTDVSKKEQIDAAFDLVVNKFGPIDVFVDNAGYVTTGTVTELSNDDAWITFETNMKGSIYTAQAFSRTARKDHAVVIDVSSIAAIMPPLPGAAAYSTSKLAATKIWEYFAAENPNYRVVSIQPGQIETDMAKKLGLTGRDHVNLPSQFAVWLASSEADFLHGKFVCANWDVEELIARKEEFKTTDLGTIRLVGLPSF